MYESACFMAPLTAKLVVFEENLAIILGLEAFVEKIEWVGGGGLCIYLWYPEALICLRLVIYLLL